MAIDHIHYLAGDIGGRGSCTPQERQAGEYVVEQLRLLGVQDVRLEPYRGAPSTYRPFALAFTIGLFGLALAATLQGRLGFILGALLNLLGAWGMLTETDVADNWMRRLLPKADSQNVVGTIPPAGAVTQRAVLCAHLDTHRTPVFYSSKAWHRLFSLLVSTAFLSMAAGTGLFGTAAAFGWSWMRWAAVVLAPIQLFAVLMCLHADTTPFSPGANDDASGVGVILGLVDRLRGEPLSNTEVYLAFTGCEEVGSYGVAAYLDAHAREFGTDTVYLILDEVGLGKIKYLTLDGLIRKHAMHPRALELARAASARCLELGVVEKVGAAYTDALEPTKRALISLTISCDVPPQSQEASHWHQMTDTPEHVDAQTLTDAHVYTWEILRLIDQSQAPEIKMPG
jgi:hypothetical protein